MPDENLVKYIKDGLAQGRSEDVIHSMLTSNGWAQKDVDEAFNFMNGGGPAISSTAPAMAQNFSAASVSSNGSASKQNLSKGKGRMGRLRYFMWVIVLAVVSTAGSYALLFFVPNFFLSAELSILLYIAILIVSAFVVVKRFHDLNKSGWYTLALIVPVYDVYLTVELLLQCGTEGSNQYGEDPLPAGKNHNDFLNRLGSSVIFKIIIAILLSALYLVMSLRNGASQKQVEQQIDQSIVNSLIASSTNATTSSLTTSSSTPSVIPTSTTGSTSNNSQGGVDTSSWQTESIHFAPKSVCYTIQYPPTLTPAALGSSNSEGFTGGPQNTYLLDLSNDFTDSYASLTAANLGYSLQNFITSSGLNGKVMTHEGRWKIVVQAFENNQNFTLNLDPISLKNVPDISIGEAMARSIVLSCTLPASSK